MTNVTFSKGLQYIGSRSFKGCESLTSVILPDGLKYIGWGAFSSCYSLSSITIPKSLLSIGDLAFDYCTHLTSVILPEGIQEIGCYAFGNCRSLISINLPERLESIEYHCFENCTSLTSIKLPKGLKKVGSHAFNNTKIAKVELGDEILEIGDYAFDNTLITQAEIGSKISKIGDLAFGTGIRVLSIKSPTPPTLKSKKMGLNNILDYVLVLTAENTEQLYKEDPKWSDFYIVDKGKNAVTIHMSGEYSLSEEIMMQTSLDSDDITNLTVIGPLTNWDWFIIGKMRCCYDMNLSGVTSTFIPYKAFAGNSHILSIELPSKLDIIGDLAFASCPNLKRVSLPETLTSIMDQSFSGCFNLNISSLPESVKSIGYHAFWGCSNLQLSKLPALETLKSGAFIGCSRLFEIDMSRCNLTSIPFSCFEDCEKLRNISLPKEIVEIQDNAFQNTSINFIELPETLETIGEEAFRRSRLISLNLPEKCTKLATGAFADCQFLTAINLSPNITKLENKCFSNCSNIRSISSPNVTPPSIGTSAFDGISKDDCVITIPTQYINDYQNSPDWNIFTLLTNGMMLDFEIVDENGLMIKDNNEVGIDLGIIENSNYNKVAEIIIREEEQAAEDKTRDEYLYGDGIKDGKQLLTLIKTAREEASELAKENMNEIITGTLSRLYNGMSMTIGDNDGYRLYIKPAYGVDIVKVELDGKEISYDPQIDNYLMIPKIEDSGKLRLYRKYTKTLIDTIAIDPDRWEGNVGQEFQISASIQPENATNKGITWSSSDENVAIVDSNGSVKTVGIGQCIITTTASDGSGVTAYCEITVNPILVSSIEIGPEKWEGNVDQDFHIFEWILPDNATNKGITWSSSDENVAVVDSWGYVRTVGIGQCIITATTIDGSELTASCEVTVNPILVESIAIEPKRWVGNVDQNFQIIASVLPENATDKGITWSSSDEDVAVVDSEGYVKTVGVGQCIITAATIDDSGVTSSCEITVDPVLAESIVLETEMLQLNVGESCQLKAAIIPVNTTNKTLHWESDNESVLVVDNTGRITAINPGNATITATATDGSGVNATCNITVLPILAESLEINPESFDGFKDDEFTISVKISPDNTSNKDVAFSSDNDNVATVDNVGNVTIGDTGTAIILVRTLDGSNLDAWCIITSLVDDSVVNTIIDNDIEYFNIYDVNGLLIKESAQKEDLKHLIKGIYIIRYENRNIKIMIK